MRDSLSRCAQRTSKGIISRFAKKGQTIVEWRVNQNRCFPEQVRCQIIINFTVHIVMEGWKVAGGGVWVSIYNISYKLNKAF